jgi:hypothetical protein
MKAAQRQREDDADSFALETMPAFLAHPPANDREGRRPLLPRRRSFGPGTLVVSLSVFALLGLGAAYLVAPGLVVETPIEATQPRPSLPAITVASALPDDGIPSLHALRSVPNPLPAAETRPLEEAVTDVQVTLPEESSPELLMLTEHALEAQVPVKPAILLPESLPLPPAAPPEPVRTSVTSAEADKALKRAEALLERRDISAARLFLERAVEGGSARALFLLAETYDPRALQHWGVRGIRGAPDRAKDLYRQAQARGEPDAASRLARLTAH